MLQTPGFFPESEESRSRYASEAASEPLSPRTRCSEPCSPRLMKVDQTFSLCQNLQHEVRSIQSAFSTMSFELQQTRDEIQSVRDKADSAQDDVQSLRKDFASQGARLDDIFKDHSRTCVSVADLQATILHCQETMLVMDESRKMLSTKLDSLVQDQKQSRHDQKIWHENADVFSKTAVRDLQQDLENTKSRVEQAWKEQCSLAESARSNSDALRDVRNDVEQCLSEIKKGTTFSSILETRLNKAGKGIQTIHSRQADLDTQLTRMNERCDTMQVRLHSYEDSAHVAVESRRAIERETDERRIQMENISGEVTRVIELLDESMKMVSQNQSQIGNLKAAYEKFQGRVNLIHHEVKELAKDTQDLHAGVSEQRALSLMLPSIEPTSPEACMSSSRCDKWSVSSTASTASPTNSRPVSIATVAPCFSRPKSQNTSRGTPPPLNLGSPKYPEKAWT